MGRNARRPPRSESQPEPAVAGARWQSFGIWCLALAIAVSPLWVSRHLPFVDLPQHLHLISILSRLHDGATLYPQYFELRPEFTPYLAYYHLVSWLARVMPLDVANRLFLSAYVAGVPLSLAFLLRSMGKPAWPALLAVPFAYGDSLTLGFINYCGALPPAYLSLGLLVRCLQEPGRRLRWALLLALSQLAVLAMHPLPMLFLGLATPWLLATTRTPEDAAGGRGLAWLRPRMPALLGTVPVLLVIGAWALARMTPTQPVAYGVPHKVWGSPLSPENLERLPAMENLRAIPGLVANTLLDGTDRLGLLSALGLGALSFLAVWFMAWGGAARVPVLERARAPGLFAIAIGLFLWLPLHIHGYIYYVSPRFIHMAGGLSVALVPALVARPRRVFLWLACASTLATALPLIRGFRSFDREARALDTVVAVGGERPTVMGLMFDVRSRVVQYATYVHSAAIVARERGGVCNFSFALEEHMPVRYKIAPPPTFASEWRPDTFDYESQGPAYDHFLGRGIAPEQVFGDRLGRELYVAAASESFWLVRRRP